MLFRSFPSATNAKMRYGINYHKSSVICMGLVWFCEFSSSTTSPFMLNSFNSNEVWGLIDSSKLIMLCWAITMFHLLSVVLYVRNWQMILLFSSGLKFWAQAQIRGSQADAQCYILKADSGNYVSEVTLGTQFCHHRLRLG